jgi:hypothetical protein
VKDSYQEEKNRQGVVSAVNYFSPENAEQRMADMRNNADIIQEKSTPKHEKGKSPYLDTQLLQKSLTKNDEKTKDKTRQNA